MTKDYIKSFGVGLTYEKTLDDWGNKNVWLDDGCRKIRGIEIISESVCRDGKSNYSFYEQEGWY